MFRHSRALVLLSLAGLFGFRLFYGLSMPFWYEDERQVYLIGLQSFARGEWPYFGADVVWTGGQIPGALLAWLIRLPLSVWPAPESPIVLLNVLSFSALTLLAWYISRRLPDVPRWLIWMAVFTLPWTLNFSTHVVNPSYAISGAIVFFVGFFEGMPLFRRGILPFAVAWSMMGFGLLWVMQLHLSWVLLVPYLLAAGAWTLARSADGRPRTRAVARALAGFIAGAALPAGLLLPTLLRYGLDAGQTQGAVAFHAHNPLDIVRTAARVLSFASFEVTRSLGLNTIERALVILRQPIVAISVLLPFVAGFLHPLWMVVSALRRTPGDATEWTRVRWLLLATIVLIFGSYFYSVRGPQPHSFYIVFPVAILFAFTCWQVRVQRSRRMETLAAIVLACNVVLHVGLGWDRLPRLSLYVDRSLVTAAIADRNDRYLGDRRDTNLHFVDRNPRPFDRLPDDDAFRLARETEDLQVAAATWTPWRNRFSSFAITVRNRGRAAAWLDLRFRATYSDASGGAVDARDLIVKAILQPGEARTWTEVDNGRVPDRATAASLTLVGAEKAIPARRSY